jgi:hypothetical protein
MRGIPEDLDPERLTAARNGWSLAGGEMEASVRVERARCVSRDRVLARVECAETSVFANLARTKRAC